MPPKRKARPKKSAFVARKRQKWEEELKTSTPMSRSNAMALWRVLTEGYDRVDEFWPVHRSLTETRQSIVCARDALLAKLPSFPIDVFSVIIDYADPGERDPVQTKYGGPVLGRMLGVGIYDSDTSTRWKDSFEIYNKRKVLTKDVFDLSMCLSESSEPSVVDYLQKFVSKLEDSTLPEAHDLRVRFPCRALSVDPLIVFRTIGRTCKLFPGARQTSGFTVYIYPMFTTLNSNESRAYMGLLSTELIPCVSNWSRKLPDSLNDFLASIPERMKESAVLTDIETGADCPSQDLYSRTIWFTLEQIARLSPALDFPF